MDFNLHYVKALYGPDGPKAQKGVPLSNQIAVAGYIAMRVVDWGSGDNGWAAIGTIADALGMSPKTTGNAINALEKQGWLDIKVRRNRPSTYKLTIPTVTQPLPADVKSTEQNLPADVKSTEQPLPTGVNLVAGSVNFAPRSVTVTDDLYNPIKNLVEDAHESAAATNTPQQVEEDKEQPQVVDYDEQDKFVALEVEITNRLLDIYKGRADIDNGRKFVADCLAYKSICSRLSTPDGILEFFEDQRLYWKSAQASGLDNVPKSAHHFITKSTSQTAVEMFQRRRAPIWESDANRKFELAEIERLDREREEREEWERNAPPRPELTRDEIDMMNPFFSGWGQHGEAN